MRLIPAALAVDPTTPGVDHNATFATRLRNDRSQEIPSFETPTVVLFIAQAGNDRDNKIDRSSAAGPEETNVDH